MISGTEYHLLHRPIPQLKQASLKFLQNLPHQYLHYQADQNPADSAVIRLYML